MTLKSDAKFEEKLTCGYENAKRNLVTFTSALKSLKIEALMRSFYSKVEEELTFCFKIDIRILTNSAPNTQKSQIFTL